MLMVPILTIWFSGDAAFRLAAGAAAAVAPAAPGAEVAPTDLPSEMPLSPAGVAAGAASAYVGASWSRPEMALGCAELAHAATTTPAVSSTKQSFLARMVTLLPSVRLIAVIVA